LIESINNQPPLISRFSGSEMFTRTAGAEKIGEGESAAWTPRWIEEKASIAKGFCGFLDDEDSAP
jgi:hypothetical protein